MHNTDIKVDVVSATTTHMPEQPEAEFMAMQIDGDFSAKAWAFAMQAKAYAMAGEAE